MKKIYFIIIGLLLSCFATYFIFIKVLSNQIKEFKTADLNRSNISCNLVLGNDLQTMACFRNFNASYPNDYFNYADSILSYSCDSGKHIACSLRTSIDEIMTSLGIPRKSSQSLAKIISNCSYADRDENQYLNSAFDQGQYCNQLKEIATYTKDNSLLSIAVSYNCTKNLKECKETVPYNIFSSQASNESLYLINCSPKIIDDYYCTNLKKVIGFQKDFYELFYKKPYASRSMIEFDKLCSKYPEQCKVATTQPLYFNRLIYNVPRTDKNNSLKYFDKYELNFESAWFLIQNIDQGNNSYDYKNRSLKFLKLSATDQRNVIKKECSTTSNKTFCFLGLKDLSDAKKNSNLLKDYCNKGDAISCSYISMVGKSKEFKLSDDIFMLNLYINWEWVEVNYLTIEPVHKFLRTLNQARFPIVLVFSAIFIFLSFTFIIFAKKLEELLQYLKLKKLEELKQKINKSNE